LHLRSRSTTCATTTSLTASARTRTMDPPDWPAHPRSLREHPRRRTRPAVMSLRHWARTHLAFSRTVRAPPPRPETPGQSGCSTKNAESGGHSKPPVPRCDQCKSDVRLNTWRGTGAHHHRATLENQAPGNRRCLTPAHHRDRLAPVCWNRTWARIRLAPWALGHRRRHCPALVPEVT
jgi:hypothetical protein